MHQPVGRHYVIGDGLNAVMGLPVFRYSFRVTLNPEASQLLKNAIQRVA